MVGKGELPWTIDSVAEGNVSLDWIFLFLLFFEDVICLITIHAKDGILSLLKYFDYDNAVTN